MQETMVPVPAGLGRRPRVVLIAVAVGLLAAVGLIAVMVRVSKEAPSPPTAAELSAMSGVVDIHWTLQRLTVDGRSFSVANPSRYSLELLSDGSAHVLPGCSPSAGFWGYEAGGFALFGLENAAIGCGFADGGQPPPANDAAPTTLLHDAVMSLDGSIKARRVDGRLLVDVGKYHLVMVDAGKALSHPGPVPTTATR